MKVNTTLFSSVGDLRNSWKPENLNLTSKFVILNLTLENMEQHMRRESGHRPQKYHGEQN